jgi:hypothetical protein
VTAPVAERVFRERLFAVLQATGERPFVVNPQIERLSGERVFFTRPSPLGRVPNTCTAMEVLPHA